MAQAGYVYAGERVYLIFGEATHGWGDGPRTALVSVGDSVNLNRVMVHAGYRDRILSVWVMETAVGIDKTVDITGTPRLLWRGAHQDWPKIDKKGRLRNARIQKTRGKDSRKSKD